MKNTQTVIDIARQLMAISEDLRKRRSHENTTDYDKGDLYDFDQMWGSTALGFGGCGGSAMTIERTYVFIPHLIPFPDKKQEEKAFVYFGDKFAYECGVNDRLRSDIINHDIASVMESGRYNKH